MYTTVTFSLKNKDATVQTYFIMKIDFFKACSLYSQEEILRKMHILTLSGRIVKKSHIRHNKLQEV